MTLTQISNFVRVAELRNMSHAAAVIRVAQPALSRQMRALEDELGVHLLVRHGWGVTPTPAGEAFLVEARKVLRAVEGARDAATTHAADPTGRVALGMPMSLAAPLIPPLTASLRAKYPALRPHFIDGAGLALQARLLAGELDLAILYEDRNQGPLATAPLLSESLVLVGAADASVDRGLASGALVRALPLILPGRPNRHRLLVEQLAGEGQANVVAEVESHGAIMAMVEAGQGYTVTTYSGVAAEAAARRVAVFALERPGAARTLVLAHQLGRQPSAAIRAVEEELLRIVRERAETFQWRPD
ncbi:LysR family transcriptional regulator [Sphingomonas profundi]|uniref:LysR family transcriptional regulator n=1 Tax=Alterirhizorhabdus profundi TaxID=2681549 RepID=UPI0012E72A02|nr:LysR family transcriptional regulator [Sphingomonas profundi]